jgi:hypothetical protein
MHLRPCRPKPNTRPTQGGTGVDATVPCNQKKASVLRLNKRNKNKTIKTDRF